jgi:hypothetical protein
VKLLKQIITPAGHRQLSPKERAQRLGEKLKYKKVLPEDAVKFYLKDNRVYDTSDEYFNFNP